ncbi:S-layer homology domain-containing protein [Rossellomorea aquimaris]|uniref:S-layer homology domain-containing protein n=1 Tax=Rossellomorea aquimaris TaxID=189382 RepID=UPI001CFD7438|nr:S-layer homology domain-containing protein [Rossellomorea aquimaris]
MKSVRKWVSAILVLLLVFPSLSTARAEETTDIDGHWAETQIKEALHSELVNGYPDGTFKPNHSISRAEFAAMVNRKFNFSEKKKIQAPDMNGKEWYAEDLSVAVGSGYMNGYENGFMKPKSPISRQEVATIVARILDLEANSKAANVFKDSIPEWSKGSVGAVVSEKLMIGLPNGKFVPTKSITRAEAVVTLGRVERETVTYDKPGVFGPDSGTETIQSDVTVSAKDVTLQNLVIEGDLLLTEDIEEGDINLNNLTVKGTTIIKGGGENSIHVNDSTLKKVIIAKKNNKIRVVASGSTQIKEVTLQSGAKLEEEKLSGNGFGNVKIEAKEKSTITLDGIFETVVISSSDHTIHIPLGAIINTITINDKAFIKGEGKINEANINVNGVQLDIIPVKTNFKDGIKDPTSTSSGGGSYNPPSSGDNSSGEVTVEDVSNIEKTVQLGQGFTLPEKVEATMSDGTVVDKSIIWDGKASTGDIGTFIYEGVVEGYPTKVIYTLSVQLGGYSEDETGIIAYVSTNGALAHAKDVITIEKIVIQGELQGSLTLPEGTSLPITVEADNVELDLNSNHIEKLIVNGDHVTLKNGTVKNIVYKDDISSVTLSDIADLSTTNHLFNNGGTEKLTVNLKGDTNLAGDVQLKGGPIEIEGDTGEISGIVRVETDSEATFSVPVTTVVVDYDQAIVNVNENIAIGKMTVRKNATVNLGSGATIETPEKRSGVEVSVNNDAVFGIASFKVQSSLFNEVLDIVDLERYIHVSENFIQAAEPGELDGQFPQEAIETLKSAKEQADSKLSEIIGSNDDLSTKQQQVDAATSDLKSELIAFSEKRIFLDSSTLRFKLREMEQLLSRTAIGDTYGQVPQGAYDVFSTVVQEVKAAYEAGLTQDGLQEQMGRLVAAHNEFQNAYQELPFFDPNSSTIDGSISFILPEVESGEVFTDFAEFKVLDESTGKYIQTGWSIHTGDHSLGWKTMEVMELNEYRVNLDEVETVYFTIPSNKHIYTGTFTTNQFKSKGEVQLSVKDGVTGTLAVTIDSASDNFDITHLLARRVDDTLEEQWNSTYEIATSTQLSTGSYDLEVYGYDENHEYLLKKEKVEVAEGENTIQFTSDDEDTINLSYEDFTGWNLKAFDYQALDSNLRFFNHFVEDTRNLSSSIKLSDDYEGIEVGYYADHPVRAGEQWRYRISIPHQSGNDENIKTSPHFEFSIQEREDKIALTPSASLYSTYDIKIINDFGHELTDLSYYHEQHYLNYGGQITVKELSSGIEKTKALKYVREFKYISLNDVFPGAKGEVEITFSMDDSLFLIPSVTKVITVQ